ncbi:galactokinase [Granulicella rosea]|uniref:Galactokinase n=1 Tax=Granulicella rosea TaxID=474952 RepID=A0A239LAK1_9BACT|nr:galactokinase [Granulicella rosea]SNT26574.1 galactokinase [Granulicella rosea]
MDARIEALLAQHKLLTDVEPTIVQAPGRVNLLGEHTDYSGGFCMPAALSFNTLIAVSPRTDGVVRVRSVDFDQTAGVEIATLPAKGAGEWKDYPVGVLWALLQRGVAIAGADLTLQGNVPLGSGLSSSASVEVATATALLHVAGVTLTGAEIALLCQKAENLYVGAPCGIMDQFISANGKKDHALALDTRSLSFELAPLPGTVRLVVSNSMVKHSIGGGEYGTRRAEVEAGAAALGVPMLRDATLTDLQRKQSQMPDNVYRRARHVISDSQRVLDGVEALRAGDVRLFGQIMNEAHVSYRDDFEASCDECDLLQTIALALPGCFGARLTGGGFGGCTVNLVEAAASEAFAASLAEKYHAATGIKPDVYVCEIGDGAGVVA